MSFSDFLLYKIAKDWPSPKASEYKSIGLKPGSDAYHMAYANQQFDLMVSRGSGMSFRDKDVLEIGCGHGGVSCFIAAVGAKSVVGIDLDDERLGYEKRYMLSFEESHQTELPVEFLLCDASATKFENASFDIVYAPNVFEHFMNPKAVLDEAYRILCPSGLLYMPNFSSIYSKYGLHLKHGLKIGWANLVFSERTIIRAMHRLAKYNPNLYKLYPGLTSNPKHVRDLRRHQDLNDITYRKFKGMAQDIGFTIELFSTSSLLPGKILKRVPFLRNSILIDIFSYNAKAILRKPAGS